MTREEPHAKSISPAIVHLHLPSHHSLPPEQKAQMLREIDEMIRRHAQRKTEAEAQLRVNV